MKELSTEPMPILIIISKKRIAYILLVYGLDGILHLGYNK